MPGFNLNLDIPEGPNSACYQLYVMDRNRAITVLDWTGDRDLAIRRFERLPHLVRDSAWVTVDSGHRVLWHTVQKAEAVRDDAETQHEHRV